MSLSPSATHVSESEPAASVSRLSVCEATHGSESRLETKRSKSRPDKHQLVVEFLVASLFHDKKRQLAELVDSDIAMQTKRAKSGADNHMPIDKLAQKHWRVLERSLVNDIAKTLGDSQRTAERVARELEAAQAENIDLKFRLAMVRQAVH